MFETPKTDDVYQDVPFSMCPACGMMVLDEQDKICRCGHEVEGDE